VSFFGATVVDIALRQLGAPYIWAGQGDYYVREGRILPIAMAGVPVLGFDCAGLVKYCALKAGGPDLRGWWGADSLFRELPTADASERFTLVFYGRGRSATHVGIALSDTGLVLEASGGDGTTLTFQDALHRNACVRVGRNGRMDRLGYRSLDALQTLHLKPPALIPDPHATPRNP
jgi:cell wall-associated NlpC family hydrolase